MNDFTNTMKEMIFDVGYMLYHMVERGEKINTGLFYKLCGEWDEANFNKGYFWLDTKYKCMLRKGQYIGRAKITVWYYNTVGWPDDFEDLIPIYKSLIVEMFKDCINYQNQVYHYSAMGGTIYP